MLAFLRSVSNFFDTLTGGSRLNSASTCFFYAGWLESVLFLRLWHSPASRVTLRWGLFLSDEKETKESPKAGPSPALWNPPRGTGWMCVFLCSALGPVGSRRWRETSTERACFSVWLSFCCQGLTLLRRCSQLSKARLPAAGTPLLQGRPGYRNRPAIGPAAQGGLV